MSSSASPATWLPAGSHPAPRRVASRPRRPAPRGGGPGPGPDRRPEDLCRTGRHTESEWGRELHDPRRDEVDALEWLGFGQN